jgi:hypothetical protein
MAIIQVQNKRNIFKYVLLDGGSKVNIITEQLRTRLVLPKPTPYNLGMASQTTKKLLM